VSALRISLLLAVGAAGLAVVANAAGTAPSRSKVKQLHAPILALALDGSKVAYFRGCCYVTRKKKVVNPQDKVVVWNVHNGKTVDVSGTETHQLGVGGSGLYGFQVAIDGSEVAWTATLGSNTYSEDRLYTSSLAKPSERLAAYDVRAGDCEVPVTGCPGGWTGGLVSTGKRILLNQWTTDDANSITEGGLFSLRGKTLTNVASGSQTVGALAASATRVAVLRTDGTIGLYTAAGTSVLSVSPPSPQAVALSGRNLVVLEADGTLAVYDSGTGLLRQTFHLQGKPKYMQALAVHGNVAVYSKATSLKTDAVSASSIHAINLTTGTDGVIGRLNGAIAFASIDSAGLVYASNGYGPAKAGNATVVFVPFAKVAAAVS
jgi:hypothetical protein